MPHAYLHEMSSEGIPRLEPRPSAEALPRDICSYIVRNPTVTIAGAAIQAQAWALPPAAAGALGTAAPAPGRTKLSSRARAWAPAAAAAAPALEAARPCGKALAPPVPSSLPGVPKFGLAMLQGVKEALRRNVFVAGVDIGASAKGGWFVQIGVHRRHFFMKEHVLACAQEAVLDALDGLEALRARGPGSGRGIPETAFHFKVECSGSDGGR
ncbi:unnamed protein product [Prorocentrum cordatum]|uniref:Uncharacterized protein n=1 Tax=Prorocentrum cordatum TaxID=2364126 RepID=A0ABN9UE01_9DINO|nr:unnamed protein product [Polarella glacialis]